jgi:two-component system, sensor histidine kinase PdtaS
LATQSVTSPPQASRIPAASATIGVGTLLLCAVIGLAALLAWRDYEAAIERGEARALSSAHVVAAHFQWMLQASDQTLRRIDAALGPGPIEATENITNIEEAIGDLPRGFQYSVYDARGQLRLSSISGAIGVDVSDRDYFRQLKDGQDSVVSPLLEERLSNERMFVVARRIVRSGAFMGVASIGIPAARMAEFWSTMNLGPYSSVSVIRADGWLIARFPALNSTMNLSGTPVFASPEPQNGVYHNGVSPVDGLTRIVGFWRVEGAPVIAAAGIEVGQALASFRRNLIGGMLVGIPMLCLLAWGLLATARLQRAAEAHRRDLERSLERNRFLLREIHHRIKNNLQTVASLVRLQPLPAEARRSIAGRIGAMVAVHEHIYRNDEFGVVSIEQYLRRLIDEIRESADHDAEVDMDIEPLEIDRDKALPLGLLVNEVVSNAFKHAFGAADGGRIGISLAAGKDNHARLQISDNGRGFEPENVTKNMGSKLVVAFAAQLEGKVDIRSSGEGTTFILDFPLGEQAGSRYPEGG